mmetsp:Transcript_31471/g.30034  ORF Transcript_31471/g.30034 Transcript_31471/m.30034 type:complete len:152 (-) Transcript_31471:926-1381(-)
MFTYIYMYLIYQSSLDRCILSAPLYRSNASFNSNTLLESPIQLAEPQPKPQVNASWIASHLVYSPDVSAGRDGTALHHRERVPDDTASPAPIGFLKRLKGGSLICILWLWLLNDGKDRSKRLLTNGPSVKAMNKLTMPSSSGFVFTSLIQA